MRPKRATMHRNSAESPSERALKPKSNGTTQTGAFKSYAHVCAGCSKPIKRDKFLLKACDKYWHENCLRCDRCHIRLGELGSTLYFKANMNLCRQDYLEMFGETGVCSLCDKLICASEMVMKAKQNVYHLECFACQLCSQRFCVGDRFYLCENKVVCQYDYEEHILPIQRSILGQQRGPHHEVCGRLEAPDRSRTPRPPEEQEEAEQEPASRDSEDSSSKPGDERAAEAPK